METYKETECSFVYRVEAVTKVIDGDTLDCVFDLGFDVMVKHRVRMLGIDTPESRTRNLNEKVYGLLSKEILKHWVWWAIRKDRDDIEIEIRCPEADSRGKFGRILGEVWINCNSEGEFGGWTNVNRWLCENGFAVGYTGGSKNELTEEHWKNRQYLAEHNKQDLLPM